MNEYTAHLVLCTPCISIKVSLMSCVALAIESGGAFRGHEGRMLLTRAQQTLPWSDGWLGIEHDCIWFTFGYHLTIRIYWEAYRKC